MSKSDIHELNVLIKSRHSLIVIDTLDENRAIDMLTQASSDSQLDLYKWTVSSGLKRQTPSRLGIRLSQARDAASPALNHAENPDDLLLHLKDGLYSGVFILLDFVQHLSDPAQLRQFREIVQTADEKKRTYIILGTAIELPAELKDKAVHYDVGLPDGLELKKLIQKTVQHHQLDHRISSTLSEKDMDAMAIALTGLSLNQARQVINFCAFSDGRLDASDVRRAAERKARLIQDGGLLEYYPHQDNQAELGGFKALKKWLQRMSVAMDEAYRVKYNLPFPKGVLLLGVQGCGKSLSAKFIARQLGFPLLKLNSGNLFDKYIGESEKNFLRVIAMSETIAPCVLWVDELEKLLGQEGSSGGGDDSLVGRRLLGVILNWLQEKKKPVFIVATANNILALPPELQRKGRFDEIFFVDLPDEEDRCEIFRIHLEIRNLQYSKEALLELAVATKGYTGAEIEQIVVGALYECLHETHDSKNLTSYILKEALQTVPLSESRREEITELREYLADRYVNVK